jgi:hypothetical protein
LTCGLAFPGAVGQTFDSDLEITRAVMIVVILG